MRKTIAHLTTMHARDEVRIFLKECTSLKSEGYDVNLIVADGRGSDIKNGVKRHSVERARGRFHRIFILPWKMYRFARRFHAQLYHLHEPELLFIAPLLMWSGAYVIYDSHEDFPRAVLSRAWIPLIFRKLLSFIIEIIENYFVCRISAVITATPNIALRFYRINPRTVTINNFPLLSEIGEVVNVCGDLRTVCYIGGISRNRGLFEMIKALESVSACLILAGPFDCQADEIEAKMLHGWAQVAYHGIVGRDVVHRIMAQSCAGLVLFHPDPNHIKAQPNKLFEYMSAGIPVIASDFPLWRSIIDGVGCGLLAEPLNPKEIADAIRWILEHPTEAEAMGQRGRQAVVKTFNWDIEEVKLLQLYKGLLSS